MRIVACLKQVPDATEVRLDPKTNTLSREGVNSIMNPFDRHALEQAVCTREQAGGKVIALSMGPPQAQEMLRDAIACGADEAVLVSDRAFAGADTCATTYTLAQAIRAIGGADLIFCGKQAIDGDTAQVGPGLAARLSIPYVAYARKMAIAAEGVLRIERMMDDGYDEVEVRLPALVTVVKDLNKPRLPSLKGKMRAKKATVRVLTAADIGAEPTRLGLTGSPTQVVKVFAPELIGGSRIMLDGSPAEQAFQLLSKLGILK